MVTPLAAATTEKNKHKLKIYLKKLHDSFPFFLREVWRLMPPPTLPEPHWVQYDIAGFLQHGPKRRGVRGKRGISKTWITCAYILWRLFRTPSLKILLCSSTPTNSKKSLLMIRVWIAHIPFLNHLAPRQDGKWRDSAEAFDVGVQTPTRDPSVTAMGILGPLPGTRAGLIVPDDIETPENTLTRDARERLEVRSEEFEHILIPDGDIVYLGTDHHEESVYEKLEHRGYEFRSWPIAYPEPSQSIPGLAPILRKHLDSGVAKPGDPLWPERFGHDEIAMLKVSSPSTYHMQQMLMRGMADADLYPLKLRDLIVFAVHRDNAPSSIMWGTRNSFGPTDMEDEIPSVGFSKDIFYGPIHVGETFMPYHGTKGRLDPAGRGKDEMSWAIAGQLYGYIHVKHVGAVMGGATMENLETIVLSLREHGCQELTVETNFGGDMLIQLLEPVIQRFSVVKGDKEYPQYPNGWHCAVLGDHSSGQKEIRIISGLETPMAQHRVVISPQVAADTILMRQLTRITRKRGCLEHDDRIEAMAAVVSDFTDMLHQDADSRNSRNKEAAQQAVLDDWHDWARSCSATHPTTAEPQGWCALN